MPAYKPSYFQASVPSEGYEGRNRRLVLEGQRQGLDAGAAAAAAGSAGLLASRWAGHKGAPAAINTASLAAAHHGVSPKTVNLARRRGLKLHEWAKTRKGRLTASAGGAFVASRAMSTLADWKKGEINGLSTDIGRLSAGDRLHEKHPVSKSIPIAIGLTTGLKGAEKISGMTPAQRKALGVSTTAAMGLGAAGIGTAVTASSVKRRRRDLRLLRNTGISGPSVIDKRGSNVREWEYLPENVREEIIERSYRRPTVDPMQMASAARSMALAQAAAEGRRLSRRDRKRLSDEAERFVGSRAMLYSPFGQGAYYA